MKIGVGVTTYKRNAHLRLWHEQMNKHKEYDVIHVAVDGLDKERKGIAFRKNECLRALKDCDYIFLFDDDCFPINDGWVKWFIDASNRTGQNHFMYLKEFGQINITKKIPISTRENTFDISYYLNEFNNCSGCMLFLTKEVIEKVGGFNPQYGFYGYEHAGYSRRIHQAGLTPLGMYTCPEGVEDYIYSMDLDYSRKAEFQSKVLHRPSVIDVKNNILENRKVYENDFQIFQPL